MNREILLRVAREAVRTVPEVVQYLSADTLAALKGGDGSGNFDHAGRPGEVGGSAPSGGGGNRSVAQNLESDSEFLGLKYERGYIIKDGKLIITQNGRYDGVTWTKEQILEMKGAIITHNHPFDGTASLSPNDMEMLIHSGAAEIRAVSTSGTSYFISPANGWGWETSKDVGIFFERRWTEKGMSFSMSREKQTSAANEIWTEYAERVGGEYVYISK